VTSDLDPRVIRRLADMHAVYRMFGHAGELLYIGKTGHLHRFDDHAVKRWFPAVSRITLEWYETEAAARVAERRAIQTERPRYNIADTPRSHRRRRVIDAVFPPQSDPERDILADVLHVFGDGPGQWWQELADRLATHFPGRWADVTRDVVSTQCRALGVPSVSVKVKGKVLNGCRRNDVEAAAARRIASRSTATG
jgi:hypothetical protein